MNDVDSEGFIGIYVHLASGTAGYQ